MSSSRRQYPFHLIEPKWQRAWDQQQTFRAWNPAEEIPVAHPFAIRHGLGGKGTPAAELPPKYYILDMFPYPSGAGLHVGHPEGYTATDILARYHRALGYNVLHPMGWDAFGLPAEQYAIRTGQHPRATTEANIATFKRQIQALGFSYDWSREVDTTDPKYFRWTQWIFLQIYNSWFNPVTNKAEPIETLEYPPELRRRPGVEATDKPRGGDGPSPVVQHGDGPSPPLPFMVASPIQSSVAEPTPELEARRRDYRDSRRLAYVAEMPVWWCEALGTVLANEEVIDGKSEVGDFPVVRKPMRQWMLRITAYAERLLNDLESIDWTESLKEMQRNWIGRSEGAEVAFQVRRNYRQTGGNFVHETYVLGVFTTRPDTLFGATYMVLAPEHGFIQTWLAQNCIPEAWPPGTPTDWTGDAATPKEAIERYQGFVAKKSDLERTDLAKEKTGVFTGVYAINPVTNENIPVWIADYVLASYGTGAIMAVPAHDTRDLEFARKFCLEIRPVVQAPEGQDSIGYVGDGIAINSDFLNELPTREAKARISAWLEEKALGRKTINYKIRDWLFSRQRYWGEPFPIIWKRDSQGNLYHQALPETDLPLVPPPLEDYKPTPDGQPPLARAKDWVNEIPGAQRETNTMPQWAGSCWYYLRYLEGQNAAAFCSESAASYWMGTADVESSNRETVEPANASTVQRFHDSTIQRSNTSNLQRSNDSTTPGVDLYVGGTEHAVLHLLYSRFWHKVLYDLDHVPVPEPFFKLVNQGLILGEDGQKMSKARGNVVNPDDVLEEYGADALRLYEMFMGPLEMVKPWNTRGVEGVYRFLGRVWRMFVDEQSVTDFEQTVTAHPERAAELVATIQLSASIRNVAPSPAQLKTLHACIKKVTEDLDCLRFNTAISALMVFVNEALAWETKPTSILREFLILLQPFAPHLAEELWSKPIVEGPPLNVGHSPSGNSPSGSLAYATWPKFDPGLLVEDTLEIPVQVNGKLRHKIVVSATATDEEIKSLALDAEKVKPFLEGKTLKKVIVVQRKLVNLVVV